MRLQAGGHLPRGRLLPARLRLRGGAGQPRAAFLAAGVVLLGELGRENVRDGNLERLLGGAGAGVHVGLAGGVLLGQDRLEVPRLRVYQRVLPLEPGRRRRQLPGWAALRGRQRGHVRDNRDG